MAPSTAAVTRLLAQGLALNRVAFGTRFLLQPRAAGPTWVGRRGANSNATQVFVRGLGARDLGLGTGALIALRRGDTTEARRWMLAHALADGADLAATLAARRDLPARPARVATLVAGASTAIAIWSSAVLGRRDGDRGGPRATELDDRQHRAARPTGAS
jgi:hypothetical protein